MTVETITLLLMAIPAIGGGYAWIKQQQQQRRDAQEKQRATDRQDIEARIDEKLTMQSLQAQPELLKISNSLSILDASMEHHINELRKDLLANSKTSEEKLVEISSDLKSLGSTVRTLKDELTENNAELNSVKEKVKVLEERVSEIEERVRGIELTCSRSHGIGIHGS